MDRIAILTRTSAINYGTILQSYALQKYIMQFGKEVLVVDDCQPRKIYQKKICNDAQCTRYSIKEKLANYLDRLRLKVKYARMFLLEKKIGAFKKKYIKYFYINDINDLNREFDVFISGSDQIWAHAAEPELFPFYLQEMIQNDKKKISYAVSIGERTYPSQYISVVKELLNKFEHISVREETSKQVVCQYTHKAVNVVCDPVFLLDNSEWKTMAGRRKINRKYIFCYFLSDNPWYADKIKTLSKLLDCDAYVFRKSNMMDKGCKNIKCCTPEQFLNYIEFAEFVLTDSYHAFLFSMIFNKNFNVLKRFESDENNIQNARISDLMKRFEIRDRFLTQSDSLNISEMDYANINIHMQVFRETSEDFLKKTLHK